MHFDACVSSASGWLASEAAVFADLQIADILLQCPYFRRDVQTTNNAPITRPDVSVTGLYSVMYRLLRRV
jgi:hypothetical protein